MYNFGENTQEKNKRGQYVDVIITRKYEESKQKAISIIEKYEDIHEGDFWILKNETKSGGVLYSGLIMSHNACLKINDTLEKEDRFRPECVTVDKDGFGQSLVFTYCCPEQGIYEVGEASKGNCKNPYPYAMAFKRCFDRVVLKASKLAVGGIYSESEADDFAYAKNAPEGKSGAIESNPEMLEPITNNQAITLSKMLDETGSDRQKFMENYSVTDISQLTKAQYGDALNIIAKKKDTKGIFIGVEK